MEKIYNDIDDLIGKYLAREATADEARFVEGWISQNESNRKYFNQIATIYTKAASIKELQQFDTDAAWNKVRGKLQKPGDTKVVELKPTGSSFGIIFKIAASVLIALGIGFFAYRTFSPFNTKTLEVITDKETETDTLPDGSNVFLNRETKLAYSFNKKENTHNVKLNGEAYFNIKHKNDEKFIIEVDGVFIKDIGTAFNVKAYPDSKTIEVVVEEGEVMFYSPKDSGVYLRANGKGVYNKVTKEFTIENPEPNAISYKSKFFIFSDTELVTVTETLNSVYNKKIFVNGALKKCHLTVTFNNESIDEIAHVIAETLGATVTVSGDSILLEGSGCGD